MGADGWINDKLEPQIERKNMATTEHENRTDEEMMNTEVCPHCGSGDVNADDSGYAYRYWCTECDGTWEVDYEEITMAMRWIDKAGVTQVRPLGPSESLREAAPDLLSACRAARDLIADLDPHGLNTGVYDDLNAAIARATGPEGQPDVITYHLAIGTDHYAPYLAINDTYSTYAEAEHMAKALHHPDWPPSRCVIIRSDSNHHACGVTEYRNGKVSVRATGPEGQP